ncbi:hypothetical protein ACQCVH_22295 [Bacillus infantis]|uniref:hypothetical protein n=1 Tax=Bacillus infantis TaxID=324767 RepID=UPI003CEBF894
MAKKKAYQVIRPFRDKGSKEKYLPKNPYDEGDAKRVKELQEKGYLGEEIKPENEE